MVAAAFDHQNLQNPSVRCIRKHLKVFQRCCVQEPPGLIAGLAFSFWV